MGVKRVSRKPAPPASPLYPIVSVGASAGGLNAFVCFIGDLPKKFDFPVIFMQHLSAGHKSLLPDLLRHRRPDIDIQEIAGGMKIMPGKIYLCPPGKEVRISRESFQISPLPKGHFHLPIDEFFTSLAEESGERTIAVILSGAGSDGARGMQAVRSAGGTTFAQAPDTAEFAAMPLAAIGSGQVDFVLPPEEIVKEILKFRGTVPETDIQDITPGQFETFFSLIHGKTGYQFNNYKRSVVGRRIKRRMYMRGISSAQDYISLIAEKNTEAANLSSDLMIGVTSFFRDRLAWKALDMAVIRKLTAAPDDQPVRVWTPACATGEEAYSIAMALRHELDLAGRKREVQVFATDLNEKALEKAREGKYPGSIVADVPSEYMKKFFGCSEDGVSVVINKEIRESVVFARQDVLTDPPFSRLDLVICRNLLIYLEPPAQEKTIQIFHYALKDDGYLFLGNAESAGRNSALFKSLGHKKCRIYQKLKTGQTAKLSLPVTQPPERITALPLRPSPESQQSFNEFVQQALLAGLGPAAVAVNQLYDIVYNIGPTNRYLSQPMGTPTQNLLELLPVKLKNRIRGALYKAAQETGAVSLMALFPDAAEEKRHVVLRISKMKGNLLLIVFSEKNAVTKEEEGALLETSAINENALRQLENELAATRADRQSHIEQLKSLNEELQSANEELQATNEELETSKEELQSLNEELLTVNAQLQGKIEEEEITNNDLNNFLSSTNIPTLFLDHEFRVKRFTSAMSRLLKLIPADIGRPIIDMSQDGLGPELIKDAQEVLDHLAPMRKEIHINGSWYIRATLPYRTSDNHIEGVVITYNDVSDLKKAQESMFMLSALVQTADDAIISKDLNGIIQSWNRGAERIFGYNAGEALGRNISFLIPPGHKDETPDIIRRIRQGEHIERLETERMRKDGTVIPVSLTFSAIKDESGKIIGISKISHDITERKRAEEALRASEAGLARAQAIAHLANWEVDIKTNKVTGSDELYRLFNLDRGLPLDAYVERFHPDDRSRVVEAINASIQQNKPYNIDYRVVPKAGEIRYVHAEGELSFDDHGRPANFFGTVQDITERKRAGEALRQSHERMKRVLEVETVGVMFWDLTTGCMIDANDTFLNLMGYSRREVDARELTWQKLTPPEYVEASLAEIRKFQTTGRIGPYEKEYLRKDGTRQWFVFAGSSLGNNTCVEFCVDISKQKLAEQELRESEKQFHALADSIPNLAWRANGDGYITWYNRRWYEYTGTTPEQMEGWGWQTVHDPEVLPKVLEQWKASIATGEPFEMEFPLRGADGVFRAFLTRVMPLKDATGKVIRWFGTNTDISERKRAEEELKNAYQEKEILIRELYHRTKNNMNVIANLMVLQTSQIEDPGMKQLFKEAQNRIKSMAIVHEMLYQTRELSKVDLKEYFAQLVKFVLASYKRKNIKVKYDMDSIPVSLYLALPCGLILNELLSNSVKHAFPEDKDGEITIKLKALENEIKLSYSDNGVGLPDEFSIENTNSLGIRILDGLIKKQLLGDWEIIRDHGVTFNIRFDIALQDEGVL